MNINSTAYKRLLIIDDDSEDQEIFIEAVNEVDAGVQCFTSTNGEDALLQLENGSLPVPDIIFLDLNMPRLNGKQVLQEIKQRNKIQGIPVVMYSTSFAPRDIEEIKRLGAVFHLIKPSRFEELCKALTSILSTQW